MPGWLVGCRIMPYWIKRAAARRRVRRSPRRALALGGPARRARAVPPGGIADLPGWFGTRRAPDTCSSTRSARRRSEAADSHRSNARRPCGTGGRCKSWGWAQVRGWPLNCDVAPLSIKPCPNRKNFVTARTNHLAQTFFTADLDPEPPGPLWPETKGQAASLARIRGHPLQGAGGHRGKFRGQLGIVRQQPFGLDLVLRVTRRPL